MVCWRFSTKTKNKKDLSPESGSFVPLCVFYFLASRFLSSEEGRESEEEETMPQMMNPPLDCILSGWVRPVGQSQVLESS